MGISPGLVQFGEWKPDLIDLNTGVSSNILNVVPRGDGYGPFPDFVSFSQSLPSACRGGFFARNADGSISIFAATDTNIYKLDNTTFAWTNVSLGGGPYAAVPSSNHWWFRQFNTKVLCGQVNVAPQVFDVTSSTNFANLAGSPPQAAYCEIINRFVVLGGLLGFPYRVQWSGLNAITTWDNVTLQSNFQDLADSGRVIGLAGGDQFGVVFQEASLRSAVFAPGSPLTFEILRISLNDGLLSPYGVINAGDKIFYPSPQGFKVIAPGGAPTPIGKEKFDASFFKDVDTANLQLLIGATDPATTRVYWAYKSLAGQANLFDTILVYDWALERGTKIRMSGEYLMALARPGLTLEGLDSIAPGGSVDALPFSLDSISLASLASLAMAGSAHKVGFFAGSNLEAQLETPEQDGKGRRMFISAIRPMTDSADARISIAARDTAQATSSYTAESQVNDIGLCPIDGGGIDTRYARAKLRIPAGSTWTYAMGVEPEFVLTGSA